MPISVACPQGHRLKAKEKLAGKRLKCPKCGSVVQIPELGSPEPDGELVSLESTEQPAPKMDLPADGETSNASEDDMFGLGDASAQSDTLFDDNLPPLDDPLNAQAELPTAPAPQDAPMQSAVGEAKTEQDSSSKLNTTQIVALAGGGGVVGLLLVGLLAWLLFGGGDEEPPAVAGNEGPPADVAEAPDAPEPEPSGKPQAKSVEPQPTEPKSPPTKSEPAPPVREPQPFDLTQIDLDKRLDGFELPGATWAAAYDEVTGRLAVTNDEKGILVYDLDDLLDGNAAPVATLPTAGLPTAVCLKTLPDRRVFVIAGQDEAKVVLADAESLEPSGEIALEGLKFVDFLTSSLNPDDPFVYYSTQRYKRFSPSASEMEDNRTADRLGRVNLVTGEQDGHTQQQFADVIVSANGERLYARFSSLPDGVIGAWNEILDYRDASSGPNMGRIARNYTKTPVCLLGDAISGDNEVYNPSMSVHMANLDYSPGAVFRHRPVLVGLSKGVVIFGSANNYRRHVFIILPMNWLRTNRADPNDFRLRRDICPNVQSAFLDIRADSAREMAVITLDKHLVLAPLDRAKLPAEPALFVRTSPPDTVAPGELLQVELELERETKNVEFEYMPYTDWLPNEKQPLLGIMPLGEPSPKPLELHSGVRAEQSFVMLKSYESLAGRKLPIGLRIGNEVMLITKYERTKLIVQRSQSIAHGSSERIAIVDEFGRDLTTPRIPPKPKGKTLTLAAAVNSQQTIIFVNDLGPLSDEELPLDIQIGDEKMVIESVDDFKTALNVKRTEPASHSVTSEVLVLNEAALAEPVAPNLPTVEGRTFSWTPTADQVGKHIIRMRARVGKLTHEWFWEITVGNATGQ